MICTTQLEQLILYLRNALSTSTFLTSKTKHIIENSTILKLSVHLLYRKENRANWVNSLRTHGSREIRERVLFVSAFRQRFNSPTIDKLGCWCLKIMARLKASKQADKRQPRELSVKHRVAPNQSEGRPPLTSIVSISTFLKFR